MKTTCQGKPLQAALGFLVGFIFLGHPLLAFGILVAIVLCYEE